MDSKNYVQVLIDGKIYTLGGMEDEAYLQKAAGYVNDKNNTLRKLPGFSKQNAEYQNIMVQLNLADDYFKALERSNETERQRDEMEREMYSLKHELVNTQMKLEAVLKELEDTQQELEQLKGRGQKTQPEGQREPKQESARPDSQELSRKAFRAAMAAAHKNEG